MRGAVRLGALLLREHSPLAASEHCCTVPIGKFPYLPLHDRAANSREPSAAAQSPSHTERGFCRQMLRPHQPPLLQLRALRKPVNASGLKSRLKLLAFSLADIRNRPHFARKWLTMEWTRPKKIPVSFVEKVKVQVGNPTQMTVVSCIRDVALRHPAAPALAWLPATSLNGADTGVQQLSYKEVWSSAEGMADALRKLAPVEAAGGASVAVLVDEGTALPLLMLAILVARMVVSCSTLSSAEELSRGATRRGT